MDKGTWDNREVYFWKDQEGKEVIEEWQTAQCSKCGRWLTTPYMYSFYEHEYCPHCGSPMKTGGKEK